MTDDELVAFLRARWAEERRIAVEASRPGLEVPPIGEKKTREHWAWYFEDSDEPVPLRDEKDRLAYHVFDGVEDRRRARLRSINWYKMRSGPGHLRHMVVQDAYVDVGPAVHIARHAPGRVLADVDAKERVLQQYEDLRERWERSDGEDDAPAGAIDGVENVLRALAAAYAQPEPDIERYADEPPGFGW